ncbi:MAG: hypothetical protein AB1716_20340, partial [Planctomycetota bacterium]
SRLGARNGRGTQGASFFAAPNPPFGAVFTYYLKDKLQTRRERRLEAEQKATKAGRDVTLPGIEELRAEDQERDPTVVLIVQNAQGDTIRRVTGPRNAGLHRVNWDLRYPTPDPIEIREPKERDPWDEDPSGLLAPPGTYTVTLAKEVDGQLATLAGPVKFEVVPLASVMATAAQPGAGAPRAATPPELAQPPRAPSDRAQPPAAPTDRAQPPAAPSERAETPADRADPEALAFRQRVERLQRAVQGALHAAGEAETRLAHDRVAILQTPDADPALLAEVDRLRKELDRILVGLRGDETVARRNRPTPLSVAERAGSLIGNLWGITTPPTQTQRDEYRHAGQEFTRLLADLRTLIEKDLTALEAKLESAGAPWTPGRIPVWEMEDK